MALAAPDNEPLSHQELADVVAGRCSGQTKKDTWDVVPPGEMMDVLVVDAQGNVLHIVQLPVLAKDSDNRNVGIGMIVHGTTKVRFCVVRECDRQVFMLPDGEIVTRLPAHMTAGKVVRKTMPGEPEHIDRPHPVLVKVLWGIPLITAFLISGVLYYGCNPSSKQPVENKEKVKDSGPGDQKKLGK